MSNKKETSKAPAVDPNESSETKPEVQEPGSGSELQGPDNAPKEPETKQKDKTGDALSEFLAPYRKAYPKCRAFHVTSDRMVFLDGDLSLAKVHQRSLGGGEVETHKVK